MKIWKRTLKTLRQIAAATESSIVETGDRLASQEWQRIQAQGREDTIMETTVINIKGITSNNAVRQYLQRRGTGGHDALPLNPLATGKREKEQLFVYRDGIVLIYNEEEGSILLKHLFKDMLPFLDICSDRDLLEKLATNLEAMQQASKEYRFALANGWHRGNERMDVEKIQENFHRWTVYKVESFFSHSDGKCVRCGLRVGNHAIDYSVVLTGERVTWRSSSSCECHQNDDPYAYYSDWAHLE